jgi:hypothetical protein
VLIIHHIWAAGRNSWFVAISAEHGAVSAMPVRRIAAVKEGSSFLKKRSKRLLRIWFGGAGNSEPSRQSFLVLFFKKEQFA